MIMVCFSNVFIQLSLNHPEVQGMTSRTCRRIITPQAVYIDISVHSLDGLRSGMRVPQERAICDSMRLRLRVVRLL